MSKPALAPSERAEILRRVAVRFGVPVERVEALAVSREDIQIEIGREIVRTFTPN